MTFVDTSALPAYLDRDALRHDEVVAAMSAAFADRRALTHNYVLIETEALTRRRLGAAVARRLLEDVAPVMDVAWVDADLHGAADARLPRSPPAALVARRPRELRAGATERVVSALTLDRNFAREGFGLVP